MQTVVNFGAIPHKCPCCDGSGLVSRPPYVAGDQVEWVSTSCGPWRCKSCNGTGVLWPNIQNKEKETC